MGLRFRGQKRPIEQACQQPTRVLLRKRGERERGRVELPPTPDRPPLEKLRSRRADNQDGDASRPLDEVVDEVQQLVISPVKVLEDEDERSMLCHALEEPPPGRERLVAPVCVSLLLATHPSEGAQFRLDPSGFARLRDQSRYLVVKLALDGVGGVALEDPGLSLDDLRESP